MDLISRYLDLVNDYMRSHPEERTGQAHYNALRLEWPHLQHEIAGTERDCFSDDRQLPAFLDWVERALTAEERAIEDGQSRATQV
ncbi:hypothetical protein ABTZ99_40830 [Actinosynnema sp. NPDC002837]